MRNDSAAFSIKLAFNLGIWMRQNQQGQDVFEVGRCLRDIIYFNIDRPEEGAYPEEAVDANVDYLLEVALLGYIMSGVCAYDPEVKNRIPSLIEKRLVSEISSGMPEDDSGDVTDDEEGRFSSRAKTTALN